MGHNLLGRLPKSQRWAAVVELLQQPRLDTPDLARATLFAAEAQFRSLANDPALSYSFWLLTRITWAARSSAFSEELAAIGLGVNEQSSTLTFGSLVADHVLDHFDAEGARGAFSHLASLSLRHALAETVAQHQTSLFDSTVQDLQRSLRDYSTRAQFGEIAQRFFGDLLGRTLKSFLDREVGARGQQEVTGNPFGASDVMQAIDVHARQSAAIVRAFAGGWYSKHNWEAQGRISREETDRFVGYAVRKLRMELLREAE